MLLIYTIHASGTAFIAYVGAIRVESTSNLAPPTYERFVSVGSDAWTGLRTYILCNSSFLFSSSSAPGLGNLPSGPSCWLIAN